IQETLPILRRHTFGEAGEHFGSPGGRLNTAAVGRDNDDWTFRCTRSIRQNIFARNRLSRTLRYVRELKIMIRLWPPSHAKEVQEQRQQNRDAVLIKKERQTR